MSEITIAADQLASICARYRVRELSVFGSTARGEAHFGSDVDLLVDFEPNARIGFIEVGALMTELEPLFGRKVDLALKSGLKESIRDAVLHEARVLFAA